MQVLYTGHKCRIHVKWSDGTQPQKKRFELSIKKAQLKISGGTISDCSEDDGDFYSDALSSHEKVKVLLVVTKI